MEYSAKPSFKFSVKAILSPHDTNPRKRKLGNLPQYKNPSPPYISTHYIPRNEYGRPISRSRSLTPPQINSRYSPPMFHRSNSIIQSENKYYAHSDEAYFHRDIQRNGSELEDTNQKIINYTKNDTKNKTFDSDNKQTNKKSSSPTGRFRPPPFFDTVLVLRKRLYELGGKNFESDEPPSDRNVHKLWRAVEKYKVDYSLQHYFYVASLSNRCFDLVERIHQKVSRGLLEGSRDKEVNQSYFNFLYGKNETEQYRLLLLLENGEVTPKDFAKVKKHNSAKNTDQNLNCTQCNILITRLSKEKEELETKYANLRQQYEKLLLERTSDKIS